MSGRGRALAAVAALALAGYMAATLVAGTGSAAGPVLDATVGPGFTISLTQGDTPVTTLAPGAYTIDVTDMASIHDFHLQGPGVDEATSVPGTGSETWDVTFTNGQYAFFCDAHKPSMNGAFSVGTLTTTSTTSSTSTTTPTVQPTTSTTTTAMTSTTTPTTPTTPTTTAPSTATSTTPPGTTTTTTTSTTTTTPSPSPTARVVQSVRVQVQGRRAARVVVVHVDLAKAGTVRVRLLRSSRRLVGMTKRVGTRPAALTLHVPRNTPAGRYTVEVIAGGKRILRAVRLGG